MHELAPQSPVDDENCSQSLMQRPLALLAAECGSGPHVTSFRRSNAQGAKRVSGRPRARRSVGTPLVLQSRV